MNAQSTIRSIHSGPQVSCGKPERIGDIPQAIGRLEKGLDQTREFLGKLEARLIPALRPGEISATKGTPRETLQVQLADIIESNAARVEEANACIEQLINRIEL